MKVLKNNYKGNRIESVEYVSPYPKKIICENCESELEYNKSDMTYGWLGAAYLKCPLCDYEMMLEDENGIDLTIDNIEFPTHFYHTSKETGAVDCLDNKHIKKYIHDAIKYFRENKDEFAYHTGTGNLMVHVYRFSGDEDYEIYVTNDYYIATIPFEIEDYERSMY